MHDRVTATALTVYDCGAATAVLLFMHLRRRARRALADALIDEAFRRAACERLDRIQRVVDGWERGVIPPADWAEMTGGKPLPEHLR